MSDPMAGKPIRRVTEAETSKDNKELEVNSPDKTRPGYDLLTDAEKFDLLRGRALDELKAILDMEEPADDDKALMEVKKLKRAASSDLLAVGARIDEARLRFADQDKVGEILARIRAADEAMKPKRIN